MGAKGGRGGRFAVGEIKYESPPEGFKAQTAVVDCRCGEAGGEAEDVDSEGGFGEVDEVDDGIEGDGGAVEDCIGDAEGGWLVIAAAGVEEGWRSSGKGFEDARSDVGWGPGRKGLAFAELGITETSVDEEVEVAGV